MLEITMGDTPKLPGVSLLTPYVVLLICVCVSTALVYPLRSPIDSQRVIQVR